MSEWKECKLGEVAEVQTGPFGSPRVGMDSGVKLRNDGEDTMNEYV